MGYLKSVKQLNETNTCLVFLSISFLSCRKNNKSIASNSTNNTTNPTTGCGTIVPYTPLSAPTANAGPAIEIDSFPLSVGNKWSYEVQEQAWNACGQVYCDTFYYTIKVVADTVINGIRFALVTSSNNQNTYSLSTFKIPTTFFCYPAPSYYYVNFNNGLHQLSSLANTDSIYIVDSTDYIMSLPSKINSSWYSSENVATNYVTVSRSWSDYVIITTPAGTFNCIKMNVLDNVGYGEILSYGTYQCYSQKGLVLEVQQGLGLSTGSGSGSTQITRIITLTSINF